MSPSHRLGYPAGACREARLRGGCEMAAHCAGIRWLQAVGAIGQHALRCESAGPRPPHTPSMPLSLEKKTPAPLQ